ncbi:hypothetical protein DE146DRAFT_760175 [Phaeosphaeria sp. MPI-PUGE-AT-0046c]|nr:hypothetical protein DE146DRAFT_760175 [Phaeosphaeria sp. MPI-PUGE-AT-0046c]
MSLPSETTQIEDPPFYDGAEFGQDPLNHTSLYDGFISDDDYINDKVFDQLFAPSHELDPSLHQAGNQHQGSVLNIHEPCEAPSLPTVSAKADNSEINTTNVNSRRVVGDAYADQLNVKCGNQYFADAGLLNTVQSSPSQQCHQSRLHWELNDKYFSTINQPAIDHAFVASPKKPRRPSLVALRSSEEHSLASTRSSTSSLSQSTPGTADPFSPSDLKLRRGRPPLYPPLSKYEFRPEITMPEATKSNELLHSFVAAPLSPVSTCASGSAPAPKPRRGRPPLYSRSPSTPTSSQEVTREQNRLAARRFRARQEAYMATLNTQVEDLELKNKDLKDEVAKLREERLGLRDGMLEHGKCGCDVVEKYLVEETKRIGKSKYVDFDEQEELDKEGMNTDGVEEAT